MTATVARPLGALARGAGLIVPLLAVALFINYVDRGVIATAAPLMKDELRLSNSQIGVLLSAFFWTYTPGQLLAGALAERFAAYLILALGLAVWACATAATGLLSAFGLLLAVRLVLGLGEAAFFPCSSKLLAQSLPQNRLGAANGLIGMGLALGPAFGTLVGGLLMVQIGWRAVFVLFGVASLVWLWPWLTTTRGAQAAARAGADGLRAPSFAAIVRRRAAWGAALGHLCEQLWVLLRGLLAAAALFLVKGRGLLPDRHGPDRRPRLCGLRPPPGHAGGQSWLSDRRIGGRPPTELRTRKAFLVVGAVGGASSLGVCALAGPTLAVAGLIGRRDLLRHADAHDLHDRPDPGRPKSRGQMDGLSELRRQHLRRGRAPDHWLAGGPQRRRLDRCPGRGGRRLVDGRPGLGRGGPAGGPAFVWDEGRARA